MKRTLNVSGAELVNADCLEMMAGMQEGSVDLIVTDPPYFRVKPEGGTASGMGMRTIWTGWKNV